MTRAPHAGNEAGKLAERTNDHEQENTNGNLSKHDPERLSRPYRPGDWINIEGGTEGQVIEMNWRAMHVLTPRRDLAVVPNSTIAKSKILNVSFPSKIYGITVAVQLSAKVPPASGTSILELAILNCRYILAFPRPAIRVMSTDAGCALAPAEPGKTEAKGKLSAWFSERIHKLFELNKVSD